MTAQNKGSSWKWWAACGTLVVGIVVAGHFLTKGFTPNATARDAGTTSEHSAPIRVEATSPKKGEMDRTTVQPGTLQSYETVQLFSRVQGFLGEQSVDIGDRVKKGQVLARIAVPELDKQVQRNKAALDQATARVSQMDARLVSAKADRDAVKAFVKQAEATAKSALAWLRFRDKQLNRMKELFALKSIDERLVDEMQERFEAATESQNAAVATVETANAKVAAAEAKIKEVESDVIEAKAEVDVAKSELEKSEVLVGFATITAPFDGVVTQRSLFPGGFVRAAEGAGAPLLTVERTDLMRVVVQIPDRDVPYADPGAPAIIEIDALPGKKFEAKLSRVARSEDTQTRLMRAEIDLPNYSGKLCQGMYGRVTIVLEKSSHLAVPSSCLTGKSEEGQGAVYVVRDGHAHLIPVKLGKDDGIRVGILSGLKAGDRVILHPPTGLRDGAEVVVTSPD